MSSKAKFLLLLFLGFSGFGSLFRFFMQTDYAQRERAWFKAYPYEEMAARKRHLAQAEILPPPGKIQHRVRIKAIMPTLTTIPAAIIKIISPASAMAHDTVPDKQVDKKRPSHKAVPRLVAQKNPEKKNIPVNFPAQTFPETWRHNAALGFEAYRKGDYPAAIRYFEQAMKSAPDNRALPEQLAYAYEKSGQNSQAVENFKRAIDAYNDAPVPLHLRQEVERLARRFDMGGYVIYRDESSTTRQLGADLTQSQAGMEISYRPDNAVFDHKIQIYGRFLSAMAQDRLRLDPDSYQAGVGLRLKPLAQHNLVLSAERLVRVGRFARDDWMIRAGYSRDHNTTYREDKTGWWGYNLYLDAAVINPANPDIFLTGQLTTGYNMVMVKGLVVQPRLTGFASWQKDRFRQASLFEAGPGVNVRYYFNDSKYQAYGSYIDATAGYRVKISGNSIGGSGPVITLLVHF